MIVPLVLLAIAAEPPRGALVYRATLIREARFEMGLDAPVAALGAQIHQESSWNPEARSAFASGLAQFTPSTAEWVSGLYSGTLGPAQPLNPAWALRALVIYDKRLLGAVKSFETPCDRFLFALSDYNGGAGRRVKRQALSPRPGSYAVTGYLNPGISPANQRENEGYGPKILLQLQPIYASWGPGVVCGPGIGIPITNDLKVRLT